MKFFVLLLPLCLTGLAHAQTATRLGELRLLLQQKSPVFKAPAADPSLSQSPSLSPSAMPEAGPAARQLSAEERAELRRQLTDFRRPTGKGS